MPPGAIGNHTEPAWVDNPTGRGTLAVLWSCLATLFICSWTVYHPQILSYEDRTHAPSWFGNTRALEDRLFNTFVLVFLPPDIMLSGALRQWAYARRTNVVLRSLRNRSSEEQIEQYIVMGGIEMKKISNAGDETQLTVTPTGAIRLATWGKLDGIVTIANISDKNKADAIAKTIAVSQVLWMVIQCIGRAAVGLPITILEIYTLIRIVFAIAMMIFW
ncbi:hypothetical protein DFH27DRAFT_489137, partial [Peziza echinospora]